MMQPKMLSSKPVITYNRVVDYGLNPFSLWKETRALSWAGNGMVRSGVGCQQLPLVSVSAVIRQLGHNYRALMSPTARRPVCSGDATVPRRGRQLYTWRLTMQPRSPIHLGTSYMHTYIIRMCIGWESESIGRHTDIKMMAGTEGWQTVTIHRHT
ncbi:jg9682 [Pararge aegeria aegeria]|uniref:Jg9682 protein n=1 Tax=Pararge aegeria aegeria TaxID=348720 RepID=A0A8S4RVJ8_9NEOP|nr:jg9682 [Pararge aegeria aegeria]